MHAAAPAAPAPRPGPPTCIDTGGASLENTRLSVRGGVPKRPTGADCKSAGLCLRRFESFPLHQYRESNGEAWGRREHRAVDGRVMSLPAACRMFSMRIAGCERAG